jgi:hypothetical protein
MNTWHPTLEPAFGSRTYDQVQTIPRQRFGSSRWGFRYFHVWLMYGGLWRSKHQQIAEPLRLFQENDDSKTPTLERNIKI